MRRPLQERWYPRVVVPDVAWPYLKIQCGSLSHLVHERAAWEHSYAQALNDRFKIIRPFLPTNATRHLDVGGGCSGISIPLRWFYGSEFNTTVLDGTDDPPEMKLHRRTFNNSFATVGLLKHNHHGNVRVIPPEAAQPDYGHPHSKYDLITSFGSWCFHFGPSAYIEYVRSRANEGARLIVEVRALKHEWLSDLKDVFRHIGEIHKTRKWDMHVFEA